MLCRKAGVLGDKARGLLNRHTRCVQAAQGYEECGDRVLLLADLTNLPISAFAGGVARFAPPAGTKPLLPQPFKPASHEYHFACAITDALARPRTGLAPAARALIDQVLVETLKR